MTDVNIILDENELKKNKSNKIYRYNVVQIPTLRFAGFIFMAMMLMIHYVLLPGSAGWNNSILFLVIVIGYCGITWIILYLFYKKFQSLIMGDIILTLDFIIILLAIYWSGGNESFLFFLLIVRVVDQVYSDFKRVMFYSHFMVFCYFILLLYLFYVDQKSLDWANESIKIFSLYLFTIYILLTARAFTKEKRIKISAIKRAKEELIQREKAEIELRDKNQQLQEAMEEITVLRGIHPICSFCKKIRDENGKWNHIEKYIKERSEATFSHSVCPVCAEEKYPDLDFPRK